MVVTPVACLIGLRERHLVAGAERDLLQRRHAAGGHVDPVDAARSSAAWRIRWSARRSQPPSTQSVADTRMPTGLSLGKHRAHRVEDFERIAHAVFQRAAIFVGAPVGDRRQELMQEIAVRAVQLERVDAEPLGAFRGWRRRRRAPAPARPRRARAAALSPSLCGTADGAIRLPAALGHAGSAGRRPRARGSRPCGRHGRAASRPPSSNACAPRRGSASARPRWRRSRARGSPA